MNAEKMKKRRTKQTGNRQCNRSSKNQTNRANVKPLKSDEQKSINENLRENQCEIPKSRCPENNVLSEILIATTSTTTPLPFCELTVLKGTQQEETKTINADPHPQHKTKAKKEKSQAEIQDKVEAEVPSQTETKPLTSESTSKPANTLLTNRDLLIAKSPEVTALLPITLQNPDLLKELPTTKSNLTDSEVLENNTAISLIQKLIRTKLLKQKARTFRGNKTRLNGRAHSPKKKIGVTFKEIVEVMEGQLSVLPSAVKPSLVSIELTPDTLSLPTAQAQAAKETVQSNLSETAATTTKLLPTKMADKEDILPDLSSSSIPIEPSSSSPAPTLSTFDLFENNASVLMIQKLIRSKLLKQNIDQIQIVEENQILKRNTQESQETALKQNIVQNKKVKQSIVQSKILKQNIEQPKKSKENIVQNRVIQQTNEQSKALKENIEQNKTLTENIEQYTNMNSKEINTIPNPKNKKNLKILKKSKLKETVDGSKTEEERNENGVLTNLQMKSMQNLLTSDPIDSISNNLFENLQKLMNQKPISDVESSDEDEEYIEYIYKPRQYFLVSLCNLCKCDLRSQELVQCSRCHMTYYCSTVHMKNDEAHKQLCYALFHVAENCGGHIFHKCSVFTTEQFRSYRIVTIRKVETIMNRSLSPAEQEVILFPRLCANIKCREYRFDKLIDCRDCGQIAFCENHPEHRGKLHNFWCKPYKLFKELIIFQENFGRLDPSMPSKILKELPAACSNTKQILQKLGMNMEDQCEYAALTQLSTCPLTAWYVLKLCGQLKLNEVLTIHLIGAEIEFEVDMLHKWELFFLHITPSVKQLNVVFIGPELNQRNISFQQLKKIKCCSSCRKNHRIVKYYFENKIYHDYCREQESFLKPNLICFFNAGLYRSTGYHLEDTWPETIFAAANLKCPIVITSYTEYEAPLDMTRFIQETNRRLNVILPPIINPFASEKPERNFISDEDAPLIFKNFYCFVVE